jgi:hypothetical protein
MRKKIRNMKKSQTASLLELYLSNKELDSKDVFGMMVDMLLAGIDTVSREKRNCLHQQPMCILPWCCIFFSIFADVVQLQFRSLSHCSQSGQTDENI